ncbi:molybdopterin-synthase adenylyltransferase MoeB [Chromatium okenii]|jgi:adenylyltransferase/sulfurtransferase|uniref:HesA/MoeB/ThiF family protein n=1 Tax=Chromatium okenii TaxID=61644 RepID=UPI0026F19F5E|nr:molybdopterin-synthase adenylyltransferase MoeB [Chromatium okenii]MBV5310047.1 molybdopterin-synthase adenylyltransferase MoeB [Chromatium okenii]
MINDQLSRYSRQILLPNFGITGQERLQAARVLIVGLGGLGSPVALYLAAAGVGRLLLADGDTVELSNLHRQIVHTTSRIGMLKAQSAQLALAEQNPEVELVTIEHRLTADNLPPLLAEVDVVVDCCDNFATRFALNAACVAARRPLVSGAVLRLEGQVTVFSGQPGDPCYRCLYPDSEDFNGDTCATNGILAPIAGIIGSTQAAETLKILTGIGTPLIGQLLVLDGLTMRWRSLRLRADPACPVCTQPR